MTCGALNSNSTTSTIQNRNLSDTLTAVGTMVEIDLKPFDIEVFFDGGCPLCASEMNWLRRRDKAGRIKFTDIDDSAFDAAAHGKSVAELMAQMHGRLPDGKWLRGVEVFRHIYSAIGFRWLVFISRLPILSQTLDIGYWFFSKYRRRLTGRCTASACNTRNATTELIKRR
jgi:predicted DCC family thiol-disulfide oxidoreductase YuxK